MDIFQKIQDNQEKINKLKPFEKDKLKSLKDFFKIEITYSSNSLEGNSLTMSETKILIEDGLTIGGKPLKDSLEAIGHANAYEYMFSIIDKKFITKQDILELHRLFYYHIDEKNAGKYRNIQVYISGSSYPVTHYANIQSEMEELEIWLQENRNRYNIVEYSALLHKKFIFIHPFIDGNGRVARLLMNTALIQEKYLPISIPPILRREYIEKLEKAHRDDREFIKFIMEVQLQTQKDFMILMGIAGAVAK